MSAVQWNARQAQLSWRGDITAEEVTKHNTTTDCWVIIKRQVYDVTWYLEMHLVGPHCILQFAGHDMTRAFKRTHGDLSLDVISKLSIGRDFVVNHFVICRVTIHCTRPFPHLIVSGAFVRIPDRTLDLSLSLSMRSP
jgi:cytochrome b involved in lipid metabolism